MSFGPSTSGPHKAWKKVWRKLLALQRHGLLRNFGVSFSTTNCIENLNSQLCKYVGRVKRWVDSEQRYRWVICGLIEIEKRMGKVKQFAQLHELAETIYKVVNEKENQS